MSAPNFILLYVAQPLASAAFYQTLLGQSPVESAPTFCMFALPGGVMLGLWGRDGVAPPATAVGGSELAFAVGGPEIVENMHAEWCKLGLTILHPPIQMDFGYNFTALDPDGHRLRVFAPGA